MTREGKDRGQVLRDLEGRTHRIHCLQQPRGYEGQPYDETGAFSDRMA